MEGRVKDGDVGHTLEDLLARADAANVGRHVQRTELDELVKLGENLRVDLDGVFEDLGAVQHAVADGVDILGRTEICDDLLEGLGVVGGAARADPLHETLRKTGLGGHVKQLVLKRAGARVYDQNLLNSLLHLTCHFLDLL